MEPASSSEKQVASGGYLSSKRLFIVSVQIVSWYNVNEAAGSIVFPLFAMFAMPSAPSRSEKLLLVDGPRAISAAAPALPNGRDTARRIGSVDLNMNMIARK